MSTVKLLIGLVLSSSGAGYANSAGGVPLSEPYQCGMELASRAGLDKIKAESVVNRVLRNTVNADPEFLRYTFAVIYQESRFRQEAVSHMDAIGIMQVTEVAAVHSRILCGLGTNVLMTTMHGNIKLGTCYLDYAMKEAGGDWNQALVMYNGGIRALTSLRKGGKIPNESAHYAVKVQYTAQSCTGTVTETTKKGIVSGRKLPTNSNKEIGK